MESIDTNIKNIQREKKLNKDGKPRKQYTRKAQKPDKPEKPENPPLPPGSPQPKSIIENILQAPSAITEMITQAISSPAKPASENTPRKNEEYAELMEKLSTLMQKRGDNIRSRTYKRAQETILSIQQDVKKPEDLMNKPGIGPTIMEKLKEYEATGTLALLEREKTNPENILSDIYGVGPKKAKELVQQGITTIAQLREQQDKVLNDVQKMGLKYYEDILKPIPRQEIDEYNQVFNEVFETIKTSGDHYEIVGSYRRGKSSSGDIDVIITSNTPTLFKQWVDKLLERKLIIEVLSRGNTKCLVIAKLGDHPARRVDFLFSNPAEYPYAILYFTGSKGFNATMRGHALKMGYSLNEHGLSKMVDKKKEGEKLSLNIRDERAIFDFLGLEYREPNERIDGRAVVVKSGGPKESPKVSEIPMEKPPSKISPKVSEIPMEKPPSKISPKVSEPPLEKPPSKNSPKSRKKQVKINASKGSPTTRKKFPKEKSALKYCKELIAKHQKDNDAKTSPKSPKYSKKKEKAPKKSKTQKDINIKPLSILQSPKDANKMTPTEIETTKSMIQQFKDSGISAIESLTQQQLANMIVLANTEYYNTTEPLMTDNEYDIVKEYAQTKFPKNEAIQQIGAPIQGKNKVKLPYEMWSMDKIKPDSNALSTWRNKYKGPYITSCKLDGVSGLYSTEGPAPKLYTRGDGKVGQDISHLIPILNLPKPSTPIVARGEFIIPKSVFAEKYAKTFANPRNLVSGIINAKTPDEKAKDLHFVAYELIAPQAKPSEQLKTLADAGFEVVENKTYDTITNESLSEILQDKRTKYQYEIDGIIVTDDAIHPRTTGNPDHAFAFKMVLSDQKAEAKVIDVVWEASKDGYLKPRVRIEPIGLGGVTITYATGYNAKFIEENKIGIGAIVELIRSGDVIPKILSVTTPAEKAKMPAVAYTWNETHVDILLENAAEDKTVQEKNVTAFFTELEVDGLKAGNVKKIMEAGYTTIPQILKMGENDFKKAGFKTMAPKYVENIAAKIRDAPLLTIMVASGTLGRGLGNRKLGPIMTAHPDILSSAGSVAEKIAKVKTVQGIEQKSAKLFVENIPALLAFLKACDLEYKLTETPKSATPAAAMNTSHPLYGKQIVMTKVRDQPIIDALAKYGATLEDSIKTTTFALIVKSKEDVSNKTKDAEKKGVPIMTPEEFKTKYLS
jgi:NAD-dependent DNA ligase